ncbi:MAG: ABC transporter permease [Brachyspira sp.]|nr:ABC transporter permease [Brachyspira sp.]
MIKFLGLCVQNLIRSLKYLFRGQVRFESVIAQAASISYDSLPISLIIAFIAAAVIAIQVAKQFLMSGAETYIGGTIAIVMIREIAPGFVALAIGARAGTAISAEIANMQVTSQVDAIKTLKVDPVGYYFAPRIIASAFTVPMVVLLAEVIGIAGGLLVSNITIDLHPDRYMYSVWAWLSTRDIYISLLKASVFGVVIALVCATQGYETKGGAKEVGTSTTQAAILSTIYMLICDFIINLVFYIA